ncbi:MAG: glycosyl hydrolase family 8 [Planctomycetota bacterium]
MVRKRRKSSLSKSAHARRLHLQVETLERRELLAAVISEWSSMTTPGSGGRMDAISVQPGNSDSVLISGDMLSVGWTRDGGESWHGDYQGIENYQAGDFTWDPNVADRVWMGTLGGPHVSHDAGETWELAREGMPARSNGQITAGIEKILFDPNDAEGDRLLAFEGDHRQFGSAEGQHNGNVWISENNGASWGASYTIVQNGNITDAEYLGDRGTRLMVTVADNGVFVSEHDGVTWSARNNGLPSNLDALSITAHPTDEDIAWITIEGDGVFYTEDGGDNWSARNNGLTLGPNTVRYKSIELAKVDDQGIATLYVSNAPDGGSGEGVYKSTDSGLTWTHVLTNRTGITNYEVFAEGANPWWLEVDPNDPETIWAGSSARVVQSSDGGASWTDMLNDATNQEDFYVGRGFQGWVSKNFEINPHNPRHYIAQAMDSGKIMQSFDRGRTWTRTIVQANNQLAGGYDFGYNPTNADVADAVEAYEAWKSLYITDIGVPDAENMLRVSHEPYGAGRSSGEFQGYGMLFAAYLESDDAVFRKLWNYAEHYLNSEGLMSWNISADGVVEGPSSALDGDVDIGMALGMIQVQVQVD